MTDNRKYEEYITNKILAVFSVCIVYVISLTILARMLDTGNLWSTGVLISKICSGVGIAIALIGALKISNERKNKIDVSMKVLRGRNILIAGILLAVMMMAVSMVGKSAISVYYVVVPVIAVAYLIFHSYPREFFVVAIDSAVTIAMLYIIRIAQNSSNYSYLAYVVAVAVVVLAYLQNNFLSKAYKAGVKGLVDGIETKLFAEKHAMLIMKVTSIVMAAIVILGVLLGSGIAYYLIFVTIAYFFVCAVYYTVKML